MDLFDAIQKEDIKAVRQAVAAGADVNRYVSAYEGKIPLTCAPCRSKESTAIAQALLKAGADPNKYDENWTPLIHAARWGNLVVVKKLVAAGADIHAIELKGEEPKNAYLIALERHKKVAGYLKSLGGGKAKPKSTKPGSFTPSVGSWNDFSELLIKSSVEKAAEVLAKMIKGTVQLNVYGQSVKLGKKAYVIVRPKGMDWCNVFQITPPRNRYADWKKIQAFAVDLAKASGASVLSIEYSDTSNEASVYRAEPDGTSSQDAGWNREALEKIVAKLGDKAPEWARKLLENVDEDASSTEGLEMLALTEKFVVAAFNPDYEPGDELEIDFTGYGAEVFDGVAFVSSEYVL